MTKEQFMALQAQQNSKQTTTQTNNFKPFVGFFKLKNDGDEAYVRFAYSTVDDLYKDVYAVHDGDASTKWKPTLCTTNVETGYQCPLCAEGKQAKTRMFIHMLVYERDEMGNTVIRPRIWNRSAIGKFSYVAKLADYIEMNGDLRNYVFKIKRSGTTKDNTTYTETLCTSPLYNEQIYPKDFSAFEGYDIFGEHGQILPGAEAKAETIATPEFVSPAVTATPIQQVAPQAEFVAPAVNANPTTWNQPQATATPNWNPQPTSAQPTQAYPWNTNVPTY